MNCSAEDRFVVVSVLTGLRELYSDGVTNKLESKPFQEQHEDLFQPSQ